MNPYLIRYQSLDTKDLVLILDIYNDLVLPAKRALVEIIEKSPDRHEYNQNKYEKLKQSIVDEVEGIKQLEYVNWLGISLFENDGEIVIRKNRQAKERDWWGIGLGSLLTLMLIPAILAVFELYNKFNTMQFVQFILLSLIGGTGLSLLLKAADRAISQKKFRLIKNNQGILLKNCPETVITEERYPIDSQLITIKNGESIKLALKVSGDLPIDIFTFKKLEPVLNETVEYMAVKFNNWNN